MTSVSGLGRVIIGGQGVFDGFIRVHDCLFLHFATVVPPANDEFFQAEVRRWGVRVAFLAAIHSSSLAAVGLDAGAAWTGKQCFRESHGVWCPAV